jgi:ubiquitin C-terminal hydrolase
VQSLAGVPQLVEYFTSEVFAEEVGAIVEAAKDGTTKRERENGQVALAFSELLVKLKTSEAPFEPIEFLACVQKASSLFEEGIQHDSQEFLNWLLDTVHEGM